MATPQKVGVLLLGPAVQLLDASCVDLLAMLSPSYLRMCNIPASIADQGRDFEFLYISEAGPKQPFPMTGGLSCNPTHDLTTCPPLDILIVPGPPPAYQPSGSVARFLHAQLKSVEGMLCVCTAIFTFLQAGLLENLTATAPKALLPMLTVKGQGTRWVEKRWCRDGKVWTSGGVTNGLDMMAEFLRVTFGTEVATAALGLADVGDRGADY